MIQDRTPSLAGSSGKDSPNLTGWGNAAISGFQEATMEPLYERLRINTEPPHFDEYQVPEQAQRVFCEAMGRYILNDAHGFWLPPESGDGHCQPEKLIETLAERMDAMTCAFNGPEIKSPIEAMMYAGLVWLEMEWAGFPTYDFLGNGPQGHIAEFGPFSALTYSITAQAPIGAYKADFLVWFAHGKQVTGLVIECDGHDFHERTKEQASRDKRRDREILTGGFPVLRFTGSEIFRDAVSCADQVGAALSPLLTRISKDAGLIGG